MSQSDGPSEVLAPPVEPGPLPGPVAEWPRTLGVLSVVLGGIGVLWHGCQGAWGMLSSVFMPRFFSSMGAAGRSAGGPSVPNMTGLMDSMQPWVIAAAVVSLLSSAVSAWLLYAGVLLLKRRRSGIGHHRAWAWVRLGVVAASSVLMVVTQVVSARAMTAMMGAGGGAPPAGAMSGVMIGFGVVGALVYAAVGAAYPVVVLCVMRPARVEAATAGWER